MKGLKYLLVILMATSFLTACTSPIEEDAAEIKKAEDELFEKPESFNKTKAVQLVDMYEAYANNHPNDSLAAEYLFKGAEFCLNLGEGQRSIGMYSRVINEYPDFRKVPESMFLKGYVYENFMGDLEKAKTIYTEFLQRYPDNEFADDAEISIQNLGKSPEELIKQFEEEAADPQ